MGQTSWKDAFEFYEKTQPLVRTEVEGYFSKFDRVQPAISLTSEIKRGSEVTGIGPYSIVQIQTHPERAYPDPAARAQILEIFRSRKDPNKVLVYAERVTDPSKASPLMKHNLMHGLLFAYDPVFNIVMMDLGSLEKAKVPVERGGRRSLEALPLDVIIAHELKHVADSFKVIADNKPMTQACQEFRAVEFENAYRKAAYPKDAGRRYTYLDPDLLVKQQLLDAPAVARSISDPKNLEQPTVQARYDLLRSAAWAIKRSSGCKEVVDNDEIVKQAACVLQGNGVSMNGIPDAVQQCTSLKTTAPRSFR